MKQGRIRLNNGSLIPQVGLGVFQIPDDEDAKRACLQAFEAGYRHIDTAHHYYNERGVGQAVKESGIPREELWITSKLWPDEYGEAITGKAIDEMLARLDMDYLDLLLLHQQVGDYIGAWKAMERAVREGKVRAIGLSNFESGRLEEILEICTIAPPCCRWNAIHTISSMTCSSALRPTARGWSAGFPSATATRS